MTFHNFGDVWEIGGLHTLLNAGYIPRYQVDSTNTASLRLAESPGMELCLSFEHYFLEAISKISK